MALREVDVALHRRVVGRDTSLVNYSSLCHDVIWFLELIGFAR